MPEILENITANINEYRKNGVIHPQQIFSDEEMAVYQQEFKFMEQAFDNKLAYAGNLHINIKWAHELTKHPHILDFITPLLGDEIGVVGSLMLTKYPHSIDFVSWHQDGVNSQWDEDHSLTVWLAFTESNRYNGCMRVIPKTHLHSRQEHNHVVDDNNMIRKAHEIKMEVDESKALNLELLPGEISIHHNNIVHGSEPNNSDTKRMGYAIRYINPQYVDPGRAMIYAKGENKYDHIKAIESPNDFEEKNNPDAYKAFLEKNIVLK